MRGAKLLCLTFVLAGGCKARPAPESKMIPKPPVIQLPGRAPFSEALSAQLRAARPKAAGYINRLALEHSPYLLQHAENPVDWRPWGAEALAEAKRLNRPIFLSVGYSTCHWCHVMEHESFEDEEIAAYLNTHFVPIKVDREERPDIDGVYMTAVQLMTGSGGWPMTVVATPKGAPFFGGTYFPARTGDRGRSTGLLTILQRLHEVYTEDPARAVAASERLTEAIAATEAKAPENAALGEATLVEAAARMAAQFDPVHGGFGGAPKFPRPSQYELLLRYARRAQDPAASELVERSLDQMSRGGIYDHVAGGFCRYSTDARWLVPHFEKMLYDNAQLASLALHSYQLSGRSRFARLCEDILDYLLRDMQAPQGGFYSATDADSEGAEGKFFVWSPEELDAALAPADADLVKKLFSVTKAGNFEGKNILHLVGGAAEDAAHLGLSEAAREARWAEIRPKLRAAREARVQPFLDDKILVETNGQAISALAEASRVLGRPEYLAAAARAADRIWQAARRPDGRLHRMLKGEVAQAEAVLEDYAFFEAGLLELFEATAEPRWLSRAQALQATLDAHFSSPDGAYFQTGDFAERLLLRQIPQYDGAQPSGNSIAAMNLLRLAELTGQEAPRARAERLLGALSQTLKGGAAAAPQLACALDFSLDAPKELVIVTTESDDGRALKEVVNRAFLPNRALVIASEAQLAALSERLPWLKGKRALSGRATAYLCRGRLCKQPTHDPAELSAQISEVKQIQAERLRLPSAPR